MIDLNHEQDLRIQKYSNQIKIDFEDFKNQNDHYKDRYVSIEFLKKIDSKKRKFLSNELINILFEEWESIQEKYKKEHLKFYIENHIPKILDRYSKLEVSDKCSNVEALEFNTSSILEIIAEISAIEMFITLWSLKLSPVENSDPTLLNPTRFHSSPKRIISLPEPGWFYEEETINNPIDKTKSDIPVIPIVKPEKQAVSKIVRASNDNLTSLTRPQMSILMSEIQEANIVLDEKSLTNSKMGEAVNILTGYSSDQVRKDLSKIKTSFNQTEMVVVYNKLKLVLKSIKSKIAE